MSPELLTTGGKIYFKAIQLLAFQNVPFIPTGQWFLPTAYRKNLTGFVRSDFMLFWGVKRV